MPVHVSAQTIRMRVWIMSIVSMAVASPHVSFFSQHGDFILKLYYLESIKGVFTKDEIYFSVPESYDYLLTCYYFAEDFI